MISGCSVKNTERRTHEAMVAFRSLPKIRLSELVVSLWPTTRGLFVVPCTYSKALSGGQDDGLCGQVITYIALSKLKGVLSNVCDTSSTPSGSGTVSGNALCWTPPKECPHAMRDIISVCVNPCRANAAM